MSQPSAVASRSDSGLPPTSTIFGRPLGSIWVSGWEAGRGSISRKITRYGLLIKGLRHGNLDRQGLAYLAKNPRQGKLRVDVRASHTAGQIDTPQGNWRTLAGTAQPSRQKTKVICSINVDHELGCAARNGSKITYPDCEQIQRVGENTARTCGPNRKRCSKTTGSFWIHGSIEQLTGANTNFFEGTRLAVVRQKCERASDRTFGKTCCKLRVCLISFRRFAHNMRHDVFRQRQHAHGKQTRTYRGQQLVGVVRREHKHGVRRWFLEHFQQRIGCFRACFL